MKNRLIVSTILLLAVGSMNAAGLPRVGEPAPTLTLKSDLGTDMSLEELSGKWIVLYFYPRDFTSGCTIEAQNFQRDLAKYDARNAVVVGVSVDSTDSHKEFCTKEGLKFRLLADPDGKVSAAYGSLIVKPEVKYSSRNTFLIDPQGKLARIFEAVKPQGHSDEVLEALEELQKK